MSQHEAYTAKDSDKNEFKYKIKSLIIRHKSILVWLTLTILNERLNIISMTSLYVIFGLVSLMYIAGELETLQMKMLNKFEDLKYDLDLNLSTLYDLKDYVFELKHGCPPD